MYAILDIETTGGNPKNDRITEIAVLIHDGSGVVKEFSTLINPECRIPHHISALTGITNEMVAGAPRFFEIARDLVELTQGKVFVAHNVVFDYGFVRSEYRRLGYDFTRDLLCTVKLSRKLIPGLRSYSLGWLCNELHITINGRHRAMGDAAATTVLFDHLLKLDTAKDSGYFARSSRILEHHPLLDTSKIKSLPEEPGVYYFYNQDSELIYIGKSKNLRNRVLSHFTNSSTSKSMKLRTQIADIGYESTGSELIALLKESFEIKKHKPLYNRRQRRSFFRYELHTYEDPQGYVRFTLEKSNCQDKKPLACFTNKTEARRFMNRMVEKYSLCQKLSGLYPSDASCFHYEIGACKGACIGKESPDLYNQRAMKVISGNNLTVSNMLIIDAGRNGEERSVVKVENGKYAGFGYFTASYAEHDQGIIHSCVHEYPDNLEVQQIIKQYLGNYKVDRVIRY